MGYGDALITGIKNTTTEYFCIFNADGSYNPSELPGMIDLLENSNSDFVFASRYQENSGSEDDTLITLTGNKIFTFCGKLFFRLPPPLKNKFFYCPPPPPKKERVKYTKVKFCGHCSVKSTVSS